MEAGLRLWRVTREKHSALDGEGARRFGGRYSPPGYPVISLASEAGLAVLVALRYLPASREDWPTDFILGWTDVNCAPERLPDGFDEAQIRQEVEAWLVSGRSLLIAIRSRVLPEADVVLMNPLHAEFATVAPLAVRPFSFDDCMHRPPMLERFAGDLAGEQNR
ncbi:RES family NAD+ phosphorylase [Novosphingobium sp.]|uniref:RES family NAD+ phosphorylase n=1 Tax=Novosphingobium sp. TaxID=1874826 RepID=UPI0035240E5D